MGSSGSVPRRLGPEFGSLRPSLGFWNGPGAFRGTVRDITTGRRLRIAEGVGPGLALSRARTDIGDSSGGVPRPGIRGHSG